MSRINTPMDIIRKHRAENYTESHILSVIEKRCERKELLLEQYRERMKTLRQELEEALRESGRLKVVTVDAIHTDGSGRRAFYRSNCYKWDGNVWRWVEHKFEQYPNWRTRQGKFKIKVVLHDSDMPKVYPGECVGEMADGKLLLVKGFLINRGDKFDVRKTQ